MGKKFNKQTNNNKRGSVHYFIIIYKWAREKHWGSCDFGLDIFFRGGGGLVSTFVTFILFYYRLLTK